MVIIGAKGCAMEILTALRWNNTDEEVVFFDHISADLPDLLYGRYPVIRSWRELETYFRTHSDDVVLGIGEAENREIMARRVACLGGKLSTFLSNRALIGEFGNTIGAGTVILAQAAVTNHVTIGEGTLVNKNVTLSHDSRIGCFCVISPGARILGRAVVGDRTEIGANAVILPDVVVGSGCRIGAGAVVTKNVDSFTTVAGVPARKIGRGREFSCFRLKSKIRNLLYHFKTADFRKLREYNEAVAGTRKLPFLRLLSCSWVHGASFANYYELHFYEMTKPERKEYITTSLRHELTRQVNDPEKARILKDKIRFSHFYRDLLGREVLSWEDLEKPLPAPAGRIVVKPVFGQAGEGIHFPKQQFASRQEIRDYIGRTVKNPQEYLCEEYIVQHSALARLNPFSLNTLRIVTFYDEIVEKAEVWGVLLRLGVDRETDNLATGGIAAPVGHDGIVSGPAVGKHPLTAAYDTHPVTGEAITGFAVPHYHEAVALAGEAALRLKEVRSIGADVAITEQGPCLLEGNDNWCMTLLQIPYRRGLRHLADTVCDMSAVYD